MANVGNEKENLFGSWVQENGKHTNIKAWFNDDFSVNQNFFVIATFT